MNIDDLSILIVKKDLSAREVVREMLVEIFNLKEHQVRTSGSLRQEEDNITNKHYNFVMLGMSDGALKLLRWARDNDRKDINIILYSGLLLEEGLATAAEYGAIGCIPAPFKIETFTILMKHFVYLY